jgi:hypothetical protein
MWYLKGADEFPPSALRYLIRRNFPHLALAACQQTVTGNPHNPTASSALPARECMYVRGEGGYWMGSERYQNIFNNPHKTTGAYRAHQRCVPSHATRWAPFWERRGQSYRVTGDEIGVCMSYPFSGSFYGVPPTPPSSFPSPRRPNASTTTGHGSHTE